MSGRPSLALRLGSFLPIALCLGSFFPSTRQVFAQQTEPIPHAQDRPPGPALSPDEASPISSTRSP